MGNKIGTALGAPLAAWLIILYDWRAMFVITGLLGLVWLAPWTLCVRNDFPKKADMAAVMRRAATVPFRNIITSPVVWGGMIVNFCYGFFTFYRMTWTPAYLVESKGLSLTQPGLSPSSASRASPSSPSFPVNSYEATATTAKKGCAEQGYLTGVRDMMSEIAE